jgi:hypothetical protein
MLSLNSKTGIRAAWLDHDLFDAGHPGVYGPGREVHPKAVNGSFRALGDDLDSAVLEVSNKSANLMTGRGTLDKIAETDTLNEAADQKTPCDHRY